MPMIFKTRSEENSKMVDIYFELGYKDICMGSVNYKDPGGVKAATFMTQLKEEMPTEKVTKESIDDEFPRVFFNVHNEAGLAAMRDMVRQLHKQFGSGEWTLGDNIITNLLAKVSALHDELEELKKKNAT